MGGGLLKFSCIKILGKLKKKKKSAAHLWSDYKIPCICEQRCLSLDLIIEPSLLFSEIEEKVVHCIEGPLESREVGRQAGDFKQIVVQTGLEY